MKLKKGLYLHSYSIIIYYVHCKSDELYIGARGVVREVWNDGTFYSNLVDVERFRPYGYPSTSFDWTILDRAYHDTNEGAPFGETTYFNQRLTAFFVPPIDSLYTFNVISDDRCSLYISPNTSREHKVRVAYSNSWTIRRWDYFASQTAEPIQMYAGKAYYIEMVNVNWAGPWSIGFAAKIHDLAWTPDVADADLEEQKIVISSTVIPETQVQ